MSVTEHEGPVTEPTSEDPFATLRKRRCRRPGHRRRRRGPRTGDLGGYGQRPPRRRRPGAPRRSGARPGPTPDRLRRGRILGLSRSSTPPDDRRCWTDRHLLPMLSGADRRPTPPPRRSEGTPRSRTEPVTPDLSVTGSVASGADVGYHLSVRASARRAVGQCGDHAPRLRPRRRPPHPGQPLAQGETCGGAPPGRRSPVPVRGGRRRGRPPGPVAAE